MSLSGQNITVIGAGIGGLTAAIALSKRGAAVTVLEQAEAITEVGAGIQVSPNGVAVLRALGLEDDLRQQAVQASAVELRNFSNGRAVARLDLGLLPADQHYYFVHRADLIELLAHAARAHGVELRLSQQVATVTPGDTPSIEMDNGGVMQADLVVGADGLHSVVRKVLNGTHAPFFTRQTAWRATIANTMDHPNETRVHMGPGCHIVTYPLRRGSRVNIVAVKERSDWAADGWTHADDPDNLRAAFSHFSSDITEMLAQVTETGYWGLFRHPVAPIWHRGGCVLLGDAAHPTLPFMAQGAVMAMEDAWVLAEELISRAEDTNSGLEGYVLRRDERVRKVIETANGNAWKYHLSFPPLRFAAHSVIRAGALLMPRKMLSQFDWIYRHDVTGGRGTD